MTEPTIKRHNNGKIECTVVFSNEDAQKAEAQAIKAMGAKVTIPGFRAGNAPVEKIRAKLDEKKITEETVRILLPDTFEALVQEHNINPIIHPNVELTSKEPLSVTVIFIEAPKVTLKNIDKIKVEKKEPKVDEKEIQKMIDYVLKQHQVQSPKSDAVADGDKVRMDFYGDDEDGKEIENTRSTNYEVVVGSKTLIPGFEDALIGLKPKESKSFEVTFPEKYQAEHLRGKKATFHVTVHEVFSIDSPTLTEEFAQNTLGTDSVAAFKQEIEDSMKKQEEDIEHKRREAELLDKIREATTVELPEELIAEETRALVQDFQQQLDRQNMTLEQWMQATDKKADDVMTEFKENAKKRVTLRLGMQKAVEEKSIEVPEEEMNTAIAEVLEKAGPDKAALAEQYKPGQGAYEQLKWQRKVEKLLQEILIK